MISIPACLRAVVLVPLITWTAAAPAAAAECLQPLHTPAAGQFLVASRQMPDPRFRGSVILLLEHTDRGSLGVIVNRGTTVKLEQALPGVPGLAGRRDTISNGGPVARRVVIFLVRHPRKPPESGLVMGDLYFSASQVTLEQMLERGKGAAQLRLFSGHAGWGEGQLQAELSRGDWHLLPAQADQIFAAPDPELWSRLMRCFPGPGLQAMRPSSTGDGAGRNG